MKCLAIGAFGLVGFFLAGPARADNLTGVDRFLCSAGSVSVCCDDGECASGTATELGVPQFMEFDLVQKRVSSTKASGMNRMSPIDTITRRNGKIVLQGVDNGRAYSFMIDEKRGDLTAAMAVEEAGCSITGFGSCTPFSAGK